MALSPARTKQVNSAARKVLEAFHDIYNLFEDRVGQQECLRRATVAANRETDKLAADLDVPGDAIWAVFNKKLNE